MPSTFTATPAPGLRSIHYRQRWFYVLWVGLLLLSAGALVLWERPLSLDPAPLVVRLKIRGAPEGTQVQVWAGPWSRWAGPDLIGPDAPSLTLQADGSATLPLFRIPIAQRRWVKAYIPRSTWDLMMLKFTPPGGPSRSFALPLSRDIRQGLLRPRRTLNTSIATAWDSLQTDWRAPGQKP